MTTASILPPNVFISLYNLHFKTSHCEMLTPIILFMDLFKDYENLSKQDKLIFISPILAHLN